MARPKVGMHVIKSRRATGVTRGIIRAARANGFEFEVSPEAGMPPGSVGYDQGDSGTAWMSVETSDLAGFHVARTHASAAIGGAIDEALASPGWCCIMART